MRRSLSPSVIRAAERARDDPFFLAGILETYRTMNKMSLEALTAFLGCAPDDVVRLALCRRPLSGSSTFLKDVDHLAQRFAFPGERLIAIIREVEAMQAFRDHFAKAQDRNLLMAARDRDDDSSVNADEGDD